MSYVQLSGLALPVVMGALLACSNDPGSDSGTDAGMDSGTDAGADSGMDSGVAERRMFITNTVQNADFGGIAGADELCAAQAADANLEGDFKAWLSTRSSSVSDRLTRSNGPYVLVDGTTVANDWDDLVNGSILASINLDANGERRTGDVWTGTLATGDSYPNDDCAAFTSGSGGTALCGASASTDAKWTQNITPACSTRLRLYCIEQGPQTAKGD
ncbi:MAG: hypothetical protein OES69_10615 [Myxococcales bacterium]|nr:hypothetical protein [Myxococcales bacterium]MDH3844381.1 hypothetical protein [Myxococcales bacterium]